MKQAPPADRLLACEQVAQFLGVSERTVWRWVAAGKLPPPLRPGGTCARWRTADLHQYIQSLIDPTVLIAPGLSRRLRGLLTFLARKLVHDPKFADPPPGTAEEDRLDAELNALAADGAMPEAE